MTVKRTTDGKTPRADTGVERRAKGSVQEAIGKLIGDDAARDRGTAEKRAGGRPASTRTPRS